MFHIHKLHTNLPTFHRDWPYINLRLRSKIKSSSFRYFIQNQMSILIAEWLNPYSKYTADNSIKPFINYQNWNRRIGQPFAIKPTHALNAIKWKHYSYNTDWLVYGVLGDDFKWIFLVLCLLKIMVYFFEKF